MIGDKRCGSNSIKARMSSSWEATFLPRGGQGRGYGGARVGTESDSGCGDVLHSASSRSGSGHRRASVAAKRGDDPVDGEERSGGRSDAHSVPNYFRGMGRIFWIDLAAVYVFEGS